jgi:CRP-like cAMP-binding protein
MDPSLNEPVEWTAPELQLGEAGEPFSPEQVLKAITEGIAQVGEISYSIQGQNFNALLGHIETLTGLPETETEELARIGEFRRYSDGTQVFRQGERIPGIFIVIRGALKIYRASRNGRVQVLATLQPGTCVGEVQAFDGNSIPSSADAVGNTDCWLIPAEALRELFLRNPVVRDVVIRHFAGKVRHLISLVEALSLHSVPERVAQLILDYHSKNPSQTEVKFRETQEDLSKVIGSGREAFSRSLRLLAGLGLVQSAFPIVTILDLTKLQRYARG